MRSIQTTLALCAGGALITAAACSPPPPEDTGNQEDTIADTNQDTHVDPLDTSDTGEDTADQDTADTADTQDANDTSDDTGGGDDTDAGPTCTYFPDSCGQGQNCYPDLQSGGRRCETFNSSNMEGDSCGPPLADCDDGLICDPTSRQNRTCIKKCDPNANQTNCGSGATCVALPDPNNQNQTLDIGICNQDCTLFPNDSCSGQMTKCVPLSGGAKSCISHGSKQAGDSCTIPDSPPVPCAAGTLCLPNSPNSNQGTCRQICTDGSRCESDQQCANVQGADFKVCASTN